MFFDRFAARLWDFFASFYLLIHVVPNQWLNAEHILLLSLSRMFSFFVFLSFFFFFVNYLKSTLRQRKDKMSFFSVMSRKTVKYARVCTLNTENERAKTFTATLSRKWSSTELFSLNSSWLAKAGVFHLTLHKFLN